MSDPNAPAPGPAPAPGAPSPSPAPGPAPAPGPSPAQGVLIPEPAPQPKAAAEKTGDPALDLALGFFAQHGIGKDHEALKEARKTGDFSTIKALLAEKKAPDLDTYIGIAQKTADDAKASAAAKVAQTEQIVHGIAGSKEAWDQVRTWADKEAEPEERDALNRALKAGGTQAKMAAFWATAMYERAQGAKPPAPSGESAIKPNAVPASGNAPATPYATFRQGVADLTAKYGHSAQSRPAYQALIAARQAGRIQ